MKNLFEFHEVKNTITGEIYCKMPKIAWLMTEPNAPLHFLGGTIIMSYACDPERKVSFIGHMLDAFISWWRYER